MAPNFVAVSSSNLQTAILLFYAKYLMREFIKIIEDAEMALADCNDLHDEKPEKQLIKESNLPMDEASRMQRAKALGFSLKAYHGTGAAFDEFDLDKGTPSSGGGHAPHFADKRAEAKGYAKKTKGHVLEVLLRTKNPYYVNSIGPTLPNANREPRDLYLDLGKEQLRKLMTVRMPKSDDDIEGWQKYKDEQKLTLDKVYNHDNKKRIWNEVYKQLSDQGYDSIIWKDVPSDHFAGYYNKIVIFDPKNVRLISAAFDPAKSESKDLRA